MAQTSWPYVDQATTDVEYSQLFRQLQTTGVNGGLESNTLKPQGLSVGLVTTVADGSATIQGYFYLNTAAVAVAHEPASSLTRIDRVVLRLDRSQTASNRIVLAVVKGIPGSGAPALTQTNTGIYEMPLAQTTIPAGAITVSSGQVVDERISTGVGVCVWSNLTRPATWQARRGQLGYNYSASAFEWLSSSGWVQAFPVANIPNLSTSKITSGIFDVARIPTLDQNKISGVWNKGVDTGSNIRGGRVFSNDDVVAKYFFASDSSRTNYFAGPTQFDQLVRAPIFQAGPSVLNSTTLQLGNINTVTNSANLYISPNGYLNKTTSQRDAKLAIEDAPESWAERFWDLKPRTWIDRSSAERLAEGLTTQANGTTVNWDEQDIPPLTRIPGFVAEEVEEAGFPEFVDRDAEGNIVGLAYDRMLSAAIVAMKAERARVTALEARLEQLEAKLTKQPRKKGSS